MSAPLEVTVKEIQQLADEPLRQLIERLCRAELSDAGLPLSAVRAGGHQDASDGGIDVRVNLVGEVAGLDFIPRGSTGLQSKAEKVPASAVKAEMTVRGQIKPAIRELLAVGGAYVLASSKDSCTEKMLRERLAAMHQVARDAGLPAGVALDFLGADRLADWTNRHQGVALWLHEQLTGPCHGWRSYGAWAAGAADVGFLFDQHNRVDAPGPRQLTTLDALEDIRGKLRRPGHAVRLVGLSGTGKTRLVQALFEGDVGGEPLPPHLAVYCDLGEDGLQPSAVEMLRRLAASGRPQVLVVDNCNPETHRSLVGALKERSCPVSLLTVEYDIQSAEAEETEVYHLSTTTPELLRTLLARRDSSLGHAVREQIVEMSDGNLRIALALTSAVHGCGDLGGLPSTELFKRLFWQRGALDPELEHAARVLALVYSFDITQPDDPAIDHELIRLARLAGLAPQALLRHLGTLASRGLAQRRGRWRAILPQALAHRLAKEGLGAVSEAHLWRELRSHPRLSVSFARRLSPLHASQDAQQLVERWFTERPGLTLFDELPAQGTEVFSRLAPVRQDLALARLEELTAIAGEGLLGRDGWLHRNTARRVTVHLAYPAQQFAKAVEVLVRFVLREREEPSRHESDVEDLCRLFRPQASGTQAGLDLRLGALTGLLDSTAERQRLGLRVLSEALKNQWRVRMSPPFGAHVRDDGWRPQSWAELQSWYGSVLAYVACRVVSHPEQALALTEVVARAVPALADARCLASLDGFVSAAHGQPRARPLWQGLAVAILQAPRRVKESCLAETLTVLQRLEKSIRPVTLIDRIEALVFVTPHGALDVLAEEETELARADASKEAGAHAQAVA